MRPLESEVIGLPAVVARGEEVSFTLRLHNRTREAQAIPTWVEVEYGSGFEFVPGADPATYQPGVGSIRYTLDVCPPASEMVEARGTRDYEFRWQPPAEARGSGAFVIELPARLPPVKPRALRIE